MKQVISCQWTHRRGCFGLPKGTKSSGTLGLLNSKEKPEQGRITLGEERKHLNKLNIHNESRKNWLISSQGHSYLQEGQEQRAAELQDSQPHLNHQEDDENLSGNPFQRKK